MVEKIITMVSLDKRNDYGGESNIVTTTNRNFVSGGNESKESEKSRGDIFMGEFYALAEKFQPVFDGNGNKLVYFDVVKDKDGVVKEITFVDKREHIIREQKLKSGNWQNSNYATYISKLRFVRNKAGGCFLKHEGPLVDMGKGVGDRYFRVWGIAANNHFDIIDARLKLNQIENQIKQFIFDKRTEQIRKSLCESLSGKK